MSSRVILVFLLLLGSSTLAETASTPSTCTCALPARWEYKVVFVPGTWEAMEVRLPRVLEEAGEQGWELVGSYQERLVFKRRKAGQFFPDQHLAAPSGSKEKAQQQ